MWNIIVGVVLLGVGATGAASAMDRLCRPRNESGEDKLDSAARTAIGAANVAAAAGSITLAAYGAARLIYAFK